LCSEKADAFIDGFLRFSKGTVASDDSDVPRRDIGRRGETYRRGLLFVTRHLGVRIRTSVLEKDILPDIVIR
jgi:hypothetical protein